MEFPLSVVASKMPTPMIFGASYAEGAFDDESTVSILHYPAENTDDTAFVFRLTEDSLGIDILRLELTVSKGRVAVESPHYRCGEFDLTAEQSSMPTTTPVTSTFNVSFAWES